MPCCNMSIYNPRFVEPKCGDGCFCILTNGDDCICLFTDQDNKVKRCNDCKCEKSNCDCSCGENPCASDKKCSCFPTKGKTCVCVNVDKNGNIKVCDDCQCASTNENPEKSSKCIKTNASQEELISCSNCQCHSIYDCKDCQCISGKSIKFCRNTSDLKVKQCKDQKYKKTDTETESDNYCHDCKCANKNKRCTCLATEGQPCVCISVSKNGKIEFCKDCQCISGSGIKCTSGCGSSSPKGIRPCNNMNSPRNNVPDIKTNKTCIDCACSSQDKECVCLATPNGACVSVYTDRNGFIQICEGCQCSSRKFVEGNDDCHIKRYTKVVSRAVKMYCAKCACTDDGKKCVCLATAGKECVCVYTDKKGIIKLCECASEECTKYNGEPCTSRQGNMKSEVQCCQDCQCACVKDVKDNNDYGTKQCINRRYINSCCECSMRSNKKLCDTCTRICKINSKQCNNRCCISDAYSKTDKNKTCDSCKCRDQEKPYVGLIDPKKIGDNVQFCEDCQCASKKSLKGNVYNSNKCEKCCESFRQTTNVICESCTCNDEEKRCVCLVAADKTCICVYTDKRGNIQLCENCQCKSEQRKKYNTTSGMKQCQSCCSNIYCDSFLKVDTKLCGSCACRDKNKNCVCFVTANETCVCVYTDKRGDIQPCEDCQCVYENNLKGSGYKTKQCNNSRCKFFGQSNNKICESCTCRDEAKKCVCLVTADKSCVCVCTNKLGNVQLCEDCKCSFRNSELNSADHDKNQCKNRCCSTTYCKTSNRATVQFCDSCKCKDQNKICVCLITADKTCFCVYTDKHGNIQPCKDCQCTFGQLKVGKSHYGTKQFTCCCSIIYCNSFLRVDTKLCNSCACRNKSKNCVCFVTANKTCVCVYTDKRGDIQLCEDCQCVSENNLKGSVYKTKQSNNSRCDSSRQSNNKICESCTCRDEVKKCVCLITADKSCVCVYTNKRGNVQLCEGCKCSCEQKTGDHDKNSCCSTTRCKCSNRATGKFCDNCKCKNQNKNCVCLITADKTCFCVYTDKHGNIQPCEYCQCTFGQRKEGYSHYDTKQFKSGCSNIYCNRSLRVDNKLCDSCACRDQNKNCVCFLTTDETCVCVYSDKRGNVQICEDCQCSSKKM